MPGYVSKCSSIHVYPAPCWTCFEFCVAMLKLPTFLFLLWPFAALYRHRSTCCRCARTCWWRVVPRGCLEERLAQLFVSSTFLPRAGGDGSRVVRPVEEVWNRLDDGGEWNFSRVEWVIVNQTVEQTKPKFWCVCKWRWQNSKCSVSVLYQKSKKCCWPEVCYCCCCA